nr:transglutaminase domain-containing protein [uncultured Actinoplanes sp.]
MVSRRVVVSLALAGMIALSGGVLGRISADALLTSLMAGSAVGSVGLGLALRRLPNWTVAPVSAVLLAGYTLVALRVAAGRADLTDPFATIVRDALVNGIPRLLTAMIPVEPTPDTVAVPVVAAWLAGLAAAEIGVRAGRVLLGMVPVVALYAGTLYVVGPNAPSATWPTLVFAALAVGALAVSASRGRADVRAPTPSRVRTAGGAAIALVVVLGLVAGIGPWVGHRVAAAPVDPRRYVEPPRLDSLDESPLNRISGWMLAPDQRLFDVTGTAGAKGTARLRLAVLPDYDGVTWRVGATYRNAGRVLPAQPRLAEATISRVRREVVIGELTGRLMPAVATPTGVGGVRVAFDASTGTLIRPEALAPGVRYSVTSEVQSPDLNLLPAAEVPSGEAVARYLAVGANVPEPIDRLARQLADGNGAAYDRAAAIEDFLAEHYRKVPDAPSGHAYPNLAFFLFGPRGQGGQAGTSEQFAASYALLARLTGLPTRVVVGFDAPAAGGTVTGGDALAWPEVLFDGLGWVPFDPMPKGKDARPVEEDFTPKPSRQPTPPSEAPPPSASDAPGTPPVLAAAAPGGPSAAVVAGSATGSVLVLLGAAVASIIAMRRSLRRRRLGADAPDDRIAGAWAEFTDALRLAGRPVPAHLAASEAQSHAIRPAAPGPAADTWPPLDDLVEAVNIVGFAPGAADDSLAERATRQATAYTDALRARRSWWRRAWWAVHPGPLRWHRSAGGDTART